MCEIRLKEIIICEIRLKEIIKCEIRLKEINLLVTKQLTGRSVVFARSF